MNEIIVIFWNEKGDQVDNIHTLENDIDLNWLNKYKPSNAVRITVDIALPYGGLNND